MESKYTITLNRNEVLESKLNKKTILSNNISTNEVPTAKNEPLTDVVIFAAKGLNIDVKTDDIIMDFRLKFTKNKLVVRFQEKSTNDKIMLEFKKD